MRITSGVCKDDTCEIITIDVPSKVTPYNVFTPNGDGYNDWFTVKTQNILSLTCIILNRWGNKIKEYSSSDLSHLKRVNVWDGNNNSGAKVSDGTYFYIITAKGADNQNYNLHGAVLLLRK